MSSSTTNTFVLFSLCLIHCFATPLQKSKLDNLSLMLSNSFRTQQLGEAPITPKITSRQISFETETYPVCKYNFASNVFQGVDNCFQCADVIFWNELFGTEHPTARCPPSCCTVTLVSPAIGHFIVCKNGCCHRLVSLQMSPDLTEDEASVVVQSQAYIVNDATFVERTSLGKCVVNLGPSSNPECGGRCATQLNDPFACDDRQTAEVPKWGALLRLPPCSPGFPDGASAQM